MRVMDQEAIFPLVVGVVFMSVIFALGWRDTRPANKRDR